GGYGVDVRSAATGTKTWEFSVQTTEAKANATLAWPNTAATPRGTTLTLTDVATGNKVDMRTTSGYSWNTGETPATRKFRVEATPGSYDTLKLTGVSARQIGRSGVAGIGFTLTQAANVDVRVLGASGSLIRRLTGRASRAAGIHQLTWDQKSDQNVSVPSGVYTVEIRAQSQDGKTTVKQAVPYVVTR
ncbi:MAG: hypothetical protein HY248_00190, partial [Fimbriimonas ginsengisoli]|nr:hypothetical protein [Fimbriimonas ginsengisoli]